jgi:5-methylcytosine-specific restriction endonuclease McrA
MKLCSEEQKRKMREYYKKNKDVIRKRMKEYHQRPEVKEYKGKYHRKYIKENKEYWNKYQREYYKRPGVGEYHRQYLKDRYKLPEVKERMRENGKRYRQSRVGKDTMQKHYKEHRQEILRRVWEYNQRPEIKEHKRKLYLKNKEHERNRYIQWSHSKKGKLLRVLSRNKREGRLNPKISIDDIEKIYARDGGCVYCGLKESQSIDHIIPLVRGGKNTIENLVISCRFCNSSKREKLVDKWCKERNIQVPEIVNTLLILQELPITTT